MVTGEWGLTVRFAWTVRLETLTPPRIDLHQSLCMGAEGLSPERGMASCGAIGFSYSQACLVNWAVRSVEGRPTTWTAGPWGERLSLA